MKTLTDITIKTEKVSWKRLTPTQPDSLKKTNPARMDKLKKSLVENGFAASFYVFEKSSMIYILDGHHRLKALQELNAEGVDVPSHFNCTFISVKDDKHIKKLILAFISHYAELTRDGLMDFISDLDFDEVKTEFEFFELGFDLKEPDIDDDEADEVPELEEIAKSQTGEVWLLGSHRVMCGDSTDGEQVEKLMDGQKADMVFTDPPYGYEYESNRQTKHKMLKNDDKILDFLPLCNQFMENNSALYLCTSHQVIEKWKPIVSANFSYKNMIIWKKNSWSMGDLKGSFAGQHEIIIFAHKGKVSLEGNRDTDIWEFNRKNPDLHPTMKPVDLIEFAIKKITSNRVLDLFGGSGSTLIACEKTNRQAYLMEIDPHYIDVIIKRWQDYTGNEATRESDGVKFNDL